MNMPVWKCKACGCLWRDNLNETVSLLDTAQKSCAVCEHTQTQEACEIHWLKLASVSPPLERKPFKMNISREWIERMAKIEEECGDVSVGGQPVSPPLSQETREPAHEEKDDTRAGDPVTLPPSRATAPTAPKARGEG